MSDDKRDILEVLKFELSFLEQGGYGRSVRTPWKATSVFQDSTSCLNFNDPARPHACSECLLTDFVPAEAREENRVELHNRPVQLSDPKLHSKAERPNHKNDYAPDGHGIASGPLRKQSPSDQCSKGWVEPWAFAFFR